MFWLLHQVIQHQKKKSLLSTIGPSSNTSLSNSLEKRKISLYTLSECLPYSYNSKLAKMKKAYLTLGKKCSILSALLYKVYFHNFQILSGI